MRKTSSNRKYVFGIILSLPLLVAAQLLAYAVGAFPNAISEDLSALSSLITGVLYIVFTFLGIKLVYGKLLKIDKDILKIGKFRLSPVWIVTAVLLPAFVIACYFLIGSKFSVNHLGALKKLEVISSTLFIFSIAGGVVEETVFRGVLMRSVEKLFGKTAAVIVPSVLFGAAHINSGIGLAGAVQLVIGGTFVGIMFSLITIQSGNIWNSALVHACWNASSLLINISVKPDKNCLANLIINSDNFLITGGDHGMEVSVFSIIGYLLVCVLAFVMINRNKASKNISKAIEK